MLMKFTGLRSSGILVDSESTDCNMDHEALPQDYKNSNNGGEREALLMELPTSWAEGTKDAAFQETGLFSHAAVWGSLMLL